MFPIQGRLAGIDHGNVRIGVAICDPGQSIASPYMTITRGTQQSDADAFKKLVADESIVGFVIGVAVHVSGDESQQSYLARKFGEWLTATTGLPIRFHDERYSSQAADEYLSERKATRKKVKKTRDQLAAQVILTSFLESNRNRPDASQFGLDDR